MGLSQAVLKLLVKENKSFKGLALTYGVQGIMGNYDDLLQILKDNCFKYTEIPEKERLFDHKTYPTGSLHQKTLFKMLNFESVESIDISPEEGADYVCDLNNPVFEEIKKRYDFIYDGGTLEHCFNIPMVLENTLRLLKIGGMVLHATTVSGWVNHGYYQFSPIFFFDFYSQNGFECRDFKLIIDDKYYIDSIKDYLNTDFAGAKVLSFFTAVKKEEVEQICYPLQREYGEYKHIHRFFSPKLIRSKSLKHYFNNMLKLKTLRKLEFELKEL